MKQLVIQLLNYNYEVFVPIDISTTNEIVVSCAIFTDRCLYRAISIGDNGPYLNLDSKVIDTKSLYISHVITYLQSRGRIFKIPVERCVDQRRLSLNSDEYVLEPILSYEEYTSEFDTTNCSDIIDEKLIAKQGQEDTDFYNRILKGDLK